MRRFASAGMVNVETARALIVIVVVLQLPGSSLETRGALARKGRVAWLPMNPHHQRLTKWPREQFSRFGRAASIPSDPLMPLAFAKNAISTMDKEARSTGYRSGLLGFVWDYMKRTEKQQPGSPETEPEQPGTMDLAAILREQRGDQGAQGMDDLEADDMLRFGRRRRK